MNLWWGIALLCFGMVMLALTRMRGKQGPAGTTGKPREPLGPATRH